MNILLITDGLPPEVLGGTGNIVNTLAKELASNKKNTVSALSCAAKPRKPRTEDAVTYYELPARSPRWMHYRSVFSKKRAKEILQIIDEVKPDVIHAHTLGNQCGYRWIQEASRSKIPVLLTAHDVMNVAIGRVTGSEKKLWLKDLLRAKWSWNPWRTSIIRNILNRHAKVFAVSDALREFMMKNGFSAVATMHNGIDTDFWKAQDKKKARAKLNLPQDKTIFLLAGRLGFDKGTDLVVNSLPQDAHVILAGRAHLPDFAPIKDRLHYFPHQNAEGMRDMYTACDAVLVPSRCLDCFPTMCLEGMSCERPILATSWGGSKEAVIHEKTGWILDPLDTHEWNVQMKWCVLHRDELEAMGKACRAHSKKEFDISRFVESVMNAYQSQIS